MLRKPEQKLWDELSKIMHGYWDADRVENRVARDMPDLWFRFGGQEPSCGWLELKQISNWNLQKGRMTAVKHFTPGQKKWLRDNWAAGANCWFLLHVRSTNEYLFFTGAKAGVVGTEIESVTKYVASEIFVGMPNAAAIRTILTSRGLHD